LIKQSISYGYSRGRVVEQANEGAEEHIDKLAKIPALINIQLGSVHLMKRGL
jgi:hypothetical protein